MGVTWEDGNPLINSYLVTNLTVGVLVGLFPFQNRNVLRKYTETKISWTNTLKMASID
jgi:hypothetical protein